MFLTCKYARAKCLLGAAVDQGLCSVFDCLVIKQQLFNYLDYLTYYPSVCLEGPISRAETFVKLLGFRDGIRTHDPLTAAICVCSEVSLQVQCLHNEPGQLVDYSTDCGLGGGGSIPDRGNSI
jgi:hypothetical protein